MCVFIILIYLNMNIFFLYCCAHFNNHYKLNMHAYLLSLNKIKDKNSYKLESEMFPS